MRKHLYVIGAVTLMAAWNIHLHGQVYALRLVAAQPPQDVPSGAPVPSRTTRSSSRQLSPPYDPAWDEQGVDDRSAYERGRDEKEGRDKAAALAQQEAREVEADRPGEWTRTKMQGCRLARMGISEDTRPLRRRAGGGTEGNLTSDHQGIASVVRNNKGRLLLRRHRLKGKVTTWTQVMGELSPHVNRVVELKAGKPRQVWTSSLPCSGDAQPEGWDDDPQAGDWEVARMFWPGFRDKVTRLWLADGFPHVPGKPIGWGSMSGDIPNALGRGMVLVPWGDGRNGFVKWPSKDDVQVVAVISADLAAGRP